MISVNNISLYFGGQDIFKNISFMINKGDKIGLVGKNGAGKTTLLNILAKKQLPNTGEVIVPKELSLGYLRQDLDFKDGKTVEQEAISAFEEIQILEVKMKKINEQLISRTDYESTSYLNLISEFNDLEERFRISGGNDMSSKITHVLKGLGFSTYDFNRQTSEFSGGWRIRIELAKIL